MQFLLKAWFAVKNGASLVTGLDWSKVGKIIDILFLISVICTLFYVNSLENKLKASEAKVAQLSQQVKLLSDSNDLLKFSSTVDDVMCQQAIDSAKKRNVVVSQGTVKIRNLPDAGLDSKVPDSLLKSLNDSLEAQTK